jgi:predicted membrane chloride channel (bestrophin family)
MAHTHAMRAQQRSGPTQELAIADRDRFLTAADVAAMAELTNPADGILRLAGNRLREMRTEGKVCYTSLHYYSCT